MQKSDLDDIGEAFTLTRGQDMVLKVAVDRNIGHRLAQMSSMHIRLPHEVIVHTCYFIDVEHDAPFLLNAQIISDLQKLSSLVRFCVSIVDQDRLTIFKSCFAHFGAF
jgi:hypothetical protein